MDDGSRLIGRAARWFAGQLPAHESVPPYSMWVHGPRFNPEDPDAIKYHTFAGLYPDRGLFIAMNTAKDVIPASWMVSGTQIREIIAGFTPPRHQVLAQRELAGRLLPFSTVALRWDAAVATGAMLELPVAVMAFGHHRDGSLVVYQQSINVTPLVKLATAFKAAAPRVILN